MRLACALTGVVFIGFNLRWLFAPEQEAVLNALLILSSALALFILALGRTYGRGARLDRKDDSDV